MTETYFHGTTQKSGEAILKNGFGTGKKSHWRQGGESMDGRVYFTKKISTAMEYALKSQTGNGPDDDPYPKGCVVEVELEHQDVVPDEDWIGMWIMAHEFPPQFDSWKKWNVAHDLYEQAAKHPKWKSLNVQKDDFEFPKNAQLGKRALELMVPDSTLSGILHKLSTIASEVSTVAAVHITGAYFFDLEWMELDEDEEEDNPEKQYLIRLGPNFSIGETWEIDDEMFEELRNEGVIKKRYVTMKKELIKLAARAARILIEAAAKLDSMETAEVAEAAKKAAKKPHCSKCGTSAREMKGKVCVKCADSLEKMEKAKKEKTKK